MKLGPRHRRAAGWPYGFTIARSSGRLGKPFIFPVAGDAIWHLCCKRRRL
jgi:hypothetical protein